MNADTVQITAAEVKPIKYLFVNGLAEDICRPTRKYSITKINLIAAYERAKPADVLPRASGYIYSHSGLAIICSRVNILCPKSSVSNLVAKKVAPIHANHTGIKSAIKLE